MSTKIKLKLAPVSQIIRSHGLDKNGHVQRYWTHLVNKRITRYMPFKSGALSTKLKFVDGTDIVVSAPYARYQYHGKAMVNSVTGKGPAYIPGIGYRYKKGTILSVTDRNLNYDTTKHPLAGPYWDRALIAAEGNAMIAEMQAYVNSGR